MLSVDLHTGHGDYGTATVLSRAPIGSDDDLWLRSTFDGTFVETTVGNDDATLAAKTGQLGHGLVALLAERGADFRNAVTLEIGTRSETRMIWSTAVIQILPSPGCPVVARARSTSQIRGASSAEASTSIRSLGTRSCVYAAPR